MPLSKPFVVATEGQTIDGRNISREWIQQMASKYDPKVYTAVANLEHLLSYMPDSVFSPYGKVVSLSTQESTILGEKKLQLMAVVDANDAIVGMQKVGKKAFASIEVAANFVGKGFAYLTGLAFTDTPASLGTETMRFTAGKDGVYSFDTELAIEWETDEQPSSGESLFSKVKALLTGKGKADEARFTDIGNAVDLVAASQKALLDKFSAAESALKVATDEIEVLKADLEKERTEAAVFREKLDTSPDGSSKRPPASGGKGTIKTDC